jgi:ubiquinone biosynthesis protein COQ4
MLHRLQLLHVAAGARALHLTPFQRAGVAVGAAVVSFLDPARSDMVALLGEATGGPALAALRRQMAGTPDGAWLLTHRPRVRGAAFSVAALAAHPPGSLGAAYAAYVAAHGFSADARSEVRLLDDPELAYVMARYREVHDFWHVLAELPPTVLGEVALKWLEMVQTGLPVAALAALVGPARLRAKERAVLRTVYAPWALRAGRACVPLIAVRYEELLPRPLDEVRRALRLEPAPAPPLD